MAPAVAWHPCSKCGRQWPFPWGIDLTEFDIGPIDREWLCHICVQQLWSELQRKAA